MYVYADLKSPSRALRLEEPEDLGSLKVVVRAARTDHAELAEALGPIGVLDDAGNALIKIDALKRLRGGKADDPIWLESFDRMVDYAQTRGWVGRGRTLRAHCEWREQE